MPGARIPRDAPAASSWPPSPAEGKHDGRGRAGRAAYSLNLMPVMIIPTL